MDGIFVFATLLLTLISIIFLFLKKQFNYWKDRGVPYLKPSIPFGNVDMKPITMVDFYHKFYAIKDGSPFVGGFISYTPTIIATDLDFVQSILVKDFSSFSDRGFYWNEVDDPISGNLFAIDGEKWRKLRAKLTSTFTSGKTKYMFPTIVEVANRFDRILDDLTKSDSIQEVRELLARFTTDVIGTCAFGIECDSMTNPNSDFRYYGKKTFEDPGFPLILMPLIFQFPNLARRLHIRFTKKDVGDFFLDIVRETIDFREKNKIRRNDFMDLLIRLMNGESLDDHSSKPVDKLTFEEVAAQAFIFFLAGFETSSATMAYSLYELALNQDMQDKARSEIENVLKNHTGELTYEAVKDMTYIDRIISESLRKYPPAPNLMRKCTRNYRVPNTDIVIEKGMSVAIPIYSIQNDPDIYPDPEQFDPERFSPEQIKSRHPSAFLSFGDGPRNCTGIHFGRMQSRIGLITLLKNYRIKPCPKTPIPMVFAKLHALLVPEHGVHLKLEKIGIQS